METLFLIAVVVAVVLFIGGIDNDRPVSSWSEDKLHRMYGKLLNASRANSAAKNYSKADEHFNKAMAVAAEIEKRKAAKMSAAREPTKASDESVPSSEVEMQLNQELDNLETLFKYADLMSVTLAGTTVEMLRDTFINRHGSFKEFRQKGGELADHVKTLLDLANKYRSEGVFPGEWASRLCAVHASASHIDNRQLEERAKMMMDMLIDKARTFEKI